jgi:sporulation protein YlmC with PRC-barrel domain
MVPEKTSEREAELYELSMPGEFLGKEVVDSEARKVGIVRCIRLKLVPLEVSLIVKGMEVEFPVNAKDIEVAGSIIKLRTPAKHSDEIEVQDVIALREEVFAEMKAMLHNK